MGQLEIGTKIKLTDNISSKVKAEFEEYIRMKEEKEELLVFKN